MLQTDISFESPPELDAIEDGPSPIVFDLASGTCAIHSMMSAAHQHDVTCLIEV